jgi:G:T-mismatch repair DNA endonuclease (very short patch repair protein)
MRRLTNEEFIKRAKAIHGSNKYDYSKTVYKNAKIDIIIICPLVGHGEFAIRPNNHISGKQGCNKCGHKMHIFSTEDFIKRAKMIHGPNTYDYSKSIYNKMGDLLIIICPVIGHGEFNQTPSNHITHTQGCIRCTNNYKSNTIEFIEKARDIHGDTYDYSLVDYENNHTYIDIICPLHGVFSQTPGNHLYGYSCSDCANLQRANSQKKSLETFIEEANQAHSNKYDYSEVNYKNARTYITIICRTHGSFLQTPDCHLRGCGCPKCYARHSKPQIEYLNFMASLKKITIRHAENGGEYKIPNTSYYADGYDDENNTIYEYHGDFWHGNPKIYNKMEINSVTKTEFGQLYENTMKREEEIKGHGFKVNVIWDSEWKSFKKSIIKLQRLFRENKSSMRYTHL